MISLFCGLPLKFLSPYTNDHKYRHVIPNTEYFLLYLNTCLFLSFSTLFFIADEDTYTFHYDPKSWDDAQQICMQESSNLAMPKTISAIEYIRSTWGNYGSFWIGAHDASQEGQFE